MALRILLSVLIIFFLSFAEKKFIPVLIEADKLVFNKKENIARYIGNVIIKRGEITIKSKELNVFLGQKNQIKKIIAKGGITFEKKDIRGKADEAILEGDKLVLKGNAKIKQKKNIIEGDIIIYDIKNGSVEVKGTKGRVRTVIFPEK